MREKDRRTRPQPWQCEGRGHAKYQRRREKAGERKWGFRVRGQARGGRRVPIRIISNAFSVLALSLLRSTHFD